MRFITDCIYRAQRWIKGSVTLSVVEDDKHRVSSFLHGPVRMTLVGTEHTWTRVPTRTPRFTACRKQEHKVVIFQQEQVIHELHNQQLPQSFPFAMFLPKSLAPSMYFEDDQKGGCSVCYELMARYDHKSEATRSLQIVGPTLSTKIHSYHLAPVCLSLGTTTDPADNKDKEECVVLAATVEQTHVAKGGSVTVALSFRNRSSQQLQQLSVQFMETIHWKTACIEQQHSHVLSEQCNVQLPSIHALPVAGIESVDFEAMQLDMQQDLSCPEAKNSQLLISVPSTARDSYPGTHSVQVHHALMIDMMTDFSKTRQVAIPIVVFDPPMILCHQHHQQQHMPLKETITTWPE